MWRFNNLLNDGMEALEPITEQKLKTIESFKHKSDFELIDYVYSIIKGLPIFEKLPATALCHRKCNEKADFSRKTGNDVFVGNYDFMQALEYYTRAVAHAEPGSESLGFAYSNRSHLLLDQRYYDKCLQDIDRALMCNCTDNLKQKLLMRQKRAIELKSYQKNFCYHFSVPEIIHKNELIESASKSIAIDYDENGASRIVATKKIKIGDVLMVETPYVSQVDVMNKYLHCHECLELCYNMIPCENCTEALYCNENCREKAYKLYHKYECILLQYGLNFKIFLKLTLMSLLEYDRLIEDLSKTNDPVYRSNRYKEVYQIETFKKSKDPRELYEDALQPVVFYHYLTTYTDILEELNFEHKERVLKELLLRNYFIVRYNNIGIEKLRRSYICSSDYEIVGTAVYPFYSKFQHSCFSNTFPLYYGKKLVVRALTNIKKGEPVTTCFGITFTDCEKHVRQSTLLNVYNYTCRCKPCLYNWPMSGSLIEGAPVPKRFTRKIVNLLGEANLDQDRINKLLAEGFTMYNNQKVTDIPTENYIVLRCLIYELFLCFANRAID